MKWEEYRSAMERNAIKTDDMATESSYFMATHMPFSRLEYHENGRTSSAPKLVSEDQIFEKIFDNPDETDRMVIVRGDPGTGKSHLIRYYHAKLERSPATIYNPATEQLIFLRRLNNSTRGAFAQLLEQRVILDTEIEDKMRKFVAASESKDEESFKSDILYSYISAVSSDQSGKVYKPVICRDIASYLSDSRVREYLLREDGAISRCYTLISAPSDRVLKDTLIFTQEDFKVRKILKEVYRQGDPQASSFAMSLKDDDDEIDRLVTYLNRFTRDVVQRCAGISSESAKSIFTQLRKDLKKQGKNLTLFIEDFTGFTGIDSELITALSTEHGGDGSGYTDLCRVTSIIGITNDYYDQFRDNFTDRVTHQISVTDEAYGTADFLVHMAARYLNAIYCDPEEIRRWNQDGAEMSALPLGHFEPPCEWETVNIEGKTLTLYPFNSQAISRLYENLPVKSPRIFLKEVIRAQLKEYFDGKQFGDEWFFPINPSNVRMAKDPHSSAIDRLENLGDEDKKRLKAVFAIWGDGTAAGIKHSNGTITFGSVDKRFLSDIGLERFSGIGDIADEISGKAVETRQDVAPDTQSYTIHNVPENQASIPSGGKIKQHIDGATQTYLKNKDDISAWFTQKTSLKYDSDYRKWLRNLVKGDPQSCGVINWQDIGVPAYVAEGRLLELGAYYIDDQSTSLNEDKAIVVLKRDTESKDVLLALNELNYHKGWEFEEAAYYQQRLITWLERHRSQIIERVTDTGSGDPALPVLEWGLAVQYLKACILGYQIDTSSPYSAVESLLVDMQPNGSIKHETREWNDLVQFVLNKSSDFDGVFTLLKRASATTMGAVHYSVDPSSSACYRADELILAAEKLMDADWNIEPGLPETIPPNNMLYNPVALLKGLYPKIQKVVEAEAKQADNVKKKLEGYIGEINQQNVVNMLASIQELFSVFQANGVPFSRELSNRFERAPIDMANSVMQELNTVTTVETETPMKKLPVYAKNSLHQLSDFLRDIQEISRVAEQEEAKAKRELAKVSGCSNIDELAETARSQMEELFDCIEQMEVNGCAAD